MHEICAIIVAEFLGTAILVFLTCLGCIPRMSGGHISALQESITAGMAMMVAVFVRMCTNVAIKIESVLLQLFAHISGAHVNPSTTLCAMIVGRIEPILVPIYVVGEVLGSIAGYGLLQVNFAVD